MVVVVVVGQGGRPSETRNPCMIMPRELVRAQRVKAVGTAGQGSAHPRRHFGTILPRAVPTLCLKKPQDIPGPLSRAGNSNTLVFIFGLLRKWKAKMRTPSTIASTLVRPSWRRDSLAVTLERVLAPARKMGRGAHGRGCHRCMVVFTVVFW